MHKKISFLFLLTLVFTLPIHSLPLEGAGGLPSIAGLFPLENSGRLIWNFNAGWRFHLGDVANAEQQDFNDQSWEVVSTPHTVQLMPAEASGCRNYQGIAWSRKHFRLPAECKGRDVTLHFEAIMGKQTLYVNGREVMRHEGGYLPITLNLTRLGYTVDDDLVIAIKADNSDDKNYPPGKKQMTLDFAYHGGIYRDVWLIAKQKVAITDAIEENKVAGGGIFVHYANITDKSAEVYINTEVRNSDTRPRTVTVKNTLVTVNHTLTPAVATPPSSVATPPSSVATPPSSVATLSQQTKVKLQPGEAKTVTQHFTVKNPRLWSPETPYLYQIATRIQDGKENLDGGITRIGIRSFEFRSATTPSSPPSATTPDGSPSATTPSSPPSATTPGGSPSGPPSGPPPGFYLNGRRYHQLVGANRHQDFAYVGNALPNSQQWRDAKRLRDAGFTIIRTAHYPQDPSFMDACDELGLFIIVATPGWQYWNKDPQFAEKVHQNTRSIIRRDRNHPCVLMWEPILNETRYPEQFALDALQITKDEYPYPYRPVAAADVHSAGVKDHYDVVYGWPGDDFKEDRPSQCIFTREFGELVDDWYAHNNLNRASRSWGERPMLTQAMSLWRSTRELYHTTGQFIGGCQWHPFDHQRGYHPDPYWGGIYDAFRQPKTALPMFVATLSQQTEFPFLTIAHEMTQFSEKDVTVFTNCDSVRLSMYDGGHCWTLPVDCGVVTFPDAWNFFEARDWSYTKRNWQNVKMVAEGIRGGKVVCREEKMPSRRSTKLRLRVDDMGQPLVADGSDFVVVICEVTDDLGHVRRLAKENIRFTVEGEGEIIGDASINANPRAVEWGSAPVLIRSTLQAGKIKVKAEVQFPGTHAPTSAELELESIPYQLPMLYEAYRPHESHKAHEAHRPHEAHAPHTPATLSDAEKAKLLQEVEAQQADFGIQK